MSTDMKSHVGKIYVDDTKDLVDSTGPDGAQTDKNKVVRHSELPEGTRVQGPNTVVTMDFNPDRWNLYVDSDNKVTKVKQG